MFIYWFSEMCLKNLTKQQPVECQDTCIEILPCCYNLVFKEKSTSLIAVASFLVSGVCCGLSLKPAPPPPPPHPPPPPPNPLASYLQILYESSDSEDLFSSNPDAEPDYSPDNQLGTDSEREWDSPNRIPVLLI